MAECEEIGLVEGFADSREGKEKPHLTPKCFPKFTDLNYYVPDRLTYSRSVLQIQDERIATPESCTSRVEDIYYSEVTIGKTEEVDQRLGHHRRTQKGFSDKNGEDGQVRAISGVSNSDFSTDHCNMDFFELNERCETDQLQNDGSLEEELNHLDEQLIGSREQMPLRLGTLPSVPSGIIPFATDADRNVKLSSICGTDVAMAQMAENNTLPTDIALLHTVLWNLKQQQFFQIHLLQQLQNQLMHSTGNPSTRPVTPIIVPTGLSCSPVVKESALSSSENLESSASTGSCSLISERQNELTDADSILNNDINNDHLDQQQTEIQINSTQSRIKQRTPMLAMMDMSTSYLLQEKILLTGKGSVPDNSNISTSTHRHSLLPRPHDQFFKHKCRYCQKVFTSDSALQIHIRSHTGERPYRCNICGNRFSTKGNLKVHLTCHTEKYSNVHIHHNQDSMDTPDIPRDMITSAVSCNRFHSQPPRLLPIKHDTSSSRNNGFGPCIRNPFPMSFQLQSTLKPRVSQYPSEDTLKLNPEFIPSHKDSLLTGVSIWIESPNSAVRNTPVSSKLDAVPNKRLEDPQLVEILTAQKESPEKTSKLSMKSSSVIMCSSSNSMTHSPSSPQPPALSLLSSMSTSLSAYSSFSVNRASIATSLTIPNVHPPPFDFDSTSVYFPTSSLNSKREDPLEQFMEVQKSETIKMEKLVKNIDKKLTNPNQCAICYRTLSCKSALQMHYRTHTGERPFRCKICGRAFTTKGNLKTHMGVHRAKPPVRMMHQCPVCHKQFTNVLVLQQHLRMHTVELPKQVPFPGSMMIVPSTMNYIPFPGYPFFTTGFHQIRRPTLSPSQLHLSLLSGSPFLSPPRKYEIGMKRMTSVEMEKQLSTSVFSIDALKDSSSILDNIDNHEDNRSSMQIVKTKEEQTYMETESNYGDTAVALSLSDINDENDVEEETANCQDIDESNERILHAHQNRSTPSQNSLNTVTEEEGENGQKEQKEEKDGINMLNERNGYRIDSSDNEDEVKTSLETHSFYQKLSPPRHFYSASLMALEEKVKEINAQQHSINTSTSHPLEQIERIIRRTECLPPSHVLQNQDSIYNMQTNNLSDRKQTEDCRQSALINANSSMSPDHVGKLSFHLIPAENDFPCQAPLDPTLELSSQSFESTIGKPNTTCSICYKTFACKSALDIHYRSHTKERPFKCKLCDRAFSTKGNMKQHTMTHKGNNELTNPVISSSEGSCSSRSHSCPPEDGLHIRKSNSGPVRVLSDNLYQGNEGAHAEIMSNNLESISHHTTCDLHKPKMTSTDEAPTHSRKSNLRHLCQVCQKPFSSASALQIHMRTHTGDKPFKCTVCNKAFTTKGNLKVHTGTHMWNNGPSRRGRRMSVEGFTSLAPPSRCSDFFGAPHRLAHPPPHDLYPFPFPGFSNSFGGSRLNEISVIQSINSRIAHLSPASSNEIITAHLPSLVKPRPYALHHSSQTLPSSHMDNLITYRLNAITSVENDNRLEKADNPQCGNNGELDLSFKKSLPSAHVSTSEMIRNPSWAWKTSCNRCSIVCSSPGALQLHMKTHADWLNENNSPKPLMT